MTCSCDCHKPDRGLIINRCATVGGQVITLRAKVVELEKASKRTPAKTMFVERAKVAEAREQLFKTMEQLVCLEAEWEKLKTTLENWSS